MTDLVETVARAIWRNEWPGDDATPQERWLFRAHAALAAIDAAGWRVVPVEPTEAMCDAGGAALQQYIASLSEDERAALKPRKTARNDNAGYRIKPQVKCAVRWSAMLKAAPKPTP